MKNAALFAIVGTVLWTIHLLLHVITNLTGVSGSFVPVNTLIGSLVDFLAALSLLVFFAVFYKSHT